MVYAQNCTAITEILLVGAKPFHSFRVPIFILCLILYLLTCGTNVLVVYLVLSSDRLKAPMFFIIQSMSVCQLIIVKIVIPKLLSDITSEAPTITVFGCIAQIQMYGTAGNAFCFHYTLMSYDRYLAICSPLHYFSIVNNVIYLKIIIVFWISSFICSGFISLLEIQLQFCGHNIIDHFYCDCAPLLDLATSNTALPRLFANVVGAFIILFSLLFVLLTYVFIIHAILKISSTSGRKKTFSTCSSHLLAFILVYGVGLGVYMLPASIATPQTGKMFTFLYFFWTPLVNPIIYAFRNKELCVVFITQMKKIDKTFSGNKKSFK